MKYQILSKWKAESFYEAWEGYKSLFRSCQHHGLEKWLLIYLFYNGLNSESKMKIYQAVGGSIIEKNPITGEKIIEKVSMNSCLWSSDDSLKSKRDEQ